MILITLIQRFVHGPVTFLKDDPGRQEIGSFHPLNAADYTDMAYITDAETFFRAIVDDDLATVAAWCGRDDIDINRRDHCGRTPLHVAAMCASKVEIIQALIDRGARLIARLKDGRTALHIAAFRGKNDFVERLLLKSEANEQEKFEREDQEQKLKGKSPDNLPIKPETPIDDDAEDVESTGMDSDEDFNQSDSEDAEQTSAGHSFVKIEKKTEDEETPNDILTEDALDDPDIYDINVVDWDFWYV